MASVVSLKRPASVTVLAVLQIIFGCLGVVLELLQGGQALMFLLSPTALKAAAVADPMLEVRSAAPYYFEAMTVACLCGLILSLVLIADGIGLLLMRRWAYNLGVLYGWLSIVFQVAWLAYVLLVAQPVILDGLSNLPIKAGTLKGWSDPQAYRTFLQWMQIGATVLTALGPAYPIFVLVMLAAVRKAFRRSKAAPEGAVENAAEPGEAAAPAPAAAPPDERIGPAAS
jgi:hypothetical protein